MQLPSVERSASLRPAGAAMVASAVPGVIPVAPVNPSVPAAASVVNDINPEFQAKLAQAGEAAQAATPDPLKGGAQADNTTKDWTQRKPAAVKPEEPPQEPISKMLIEHVHSMWRASARVVELWLMNNPGQNQTSNQVQNLAEARNQDPTAIPGLLAKEALTYSPRKIKKPENI